MSIRTAIVAWVISGLSVAAADEGVLIDNFNEGREGWQVYDYNGGAGKNNVFYPATWEKSGGVDDSGYIWGDDSRWRIDTPEMPHSILALIIYRGWVEAGAVDLRDAKLSVYLRGDGLDLKGAKCYFWVLDNEKGTRWHCQGRPLAIHDATWGEPQRIELKADEKLWYRSWTRNPDNPASLADCLGSCDSYGFSLVGFSEEVTGKLSMDELKIELLR